MRDLHASASSLFDFMQTKYSLKLIQQCWFWFMPGKRRSPGAVSRTISLILYYVSKIKKLVEVNLQKLFCFLLSFQQFPSKSISTTSINHTLPNWVREEKEREEENHLHCSKFDCCTNMYYLVCVVVALLWILVLLLLHPTTKEAFH